MASDKEELTFAEKIRTLHFATGKTRNTTKEVRDPVDGHRIKMTKDDATTRGNITIEHNNKADQVDVQIRPDVVVMEPPKWASRPSDLTGGSD